MKWTFLFFCFIAGIACRDSHSEKKEEQPVIDTNTSKDKMPGLTINQADSVPSNIQLDSVIHLAFARDSFSVTVKGHLDKKGDPVICYLPVVQGKKLTAALIPDKPGANIRFNQVYLPDGSSDGPFGQTL